MATEMQHAMQILGSIRDASIIDNPKTGKAWFVGRVPFELAYMREDGNPITAQDAENCHDFGPRLAKLRTRIFNSTLEAQEALAEYNTANTRIDGTTIED
jgi:hypothetical protein